ncbi:unnamed protein product [Rhizophagus irregularis]|uniref:Uncharacterized protein n=1 Tax=Rhizophagus irregularis TaxID=588596 RepID=A0A916E864_9GLOM|nr:unnamed protein product [Rhizophagus irregularis]
MMVDELAGGRSLVRIITQVIGIGIEEAIQRLSKYSSPIKATVLCILVSHILCTFNPKILVLAGGVLNFPFYFDRVMEIGEKYAGVIETLVEVI